MKKRPNLTGNIDIVTFRSYYFLKKELVDFCREKSLKVSGSKEDLSERIATYLEDVEGLSKVSNNEKNELSFFKNKEKKTKFSKNEKETVSLHKNDNKNLKSSQKPSSTDDSNVIDIKNKIGTNFVCSQEHRAFFAEKIGNNFSFNVNFQKWLKNNPNKTYKDSIDAYHQILEEKKKNKGKNKIPKQFQYNQYIRDFFADNKDKSLKDAIKCWNYKKNFKTNNSYEKEDLDILNG